MYVKDNKIVCFDSFGFGHVTKETEKFIGHKNIKKKTFLEFKQTIQCVNTFALDSLILCLQVKL